MVASGCAAAPGPRHQRLPSPAAIPTCTYWSRTLRASPRTKWSSRKNSRNEYDQAIRSVGVRIIEVGDAAEYEAALGPKVAMVYIMSGPRPGKPDR